MKFQLPFRSGESVVIGRAFNGLDFQVASHALFLNLIGDYIGVGDKLLCCILLFTFVTYFIIKKG